MDCAKIGRLIHSLRKEKGITQKQLADSLNISAKTVSKWECGMGCPDISLIGELSEALNVNAEKLLEGTLDKNREESGNMKNIRFYVCPCCGSIITASGEAEISCCGRRLSYLNARQCDSGHIPRVETIENDFYITFNHEMTKKHFLSFAAYAGIDRVMLVRLYPEQDAQVRFPRMFGGRFYFYCTNHGLFEYNIGK